MNTSTTSFVAGDTSYSSMTLSPLQATAKLDARFDIFTFSESCVLQTCLTLKVDPCLESGCMAMLEMFAKLCQLTCKLIYSITIWAIVQQCSKGQTDLGGSFQNPGVRTSIIRLSD